MMESHMDISSRTLEFVRYLVREVENSENFEDRSERCFELLRCGEALYSHLERMAMFGIINSYVPVIVKEILGVLSEICDQRSRTCSSGWEAGLHFSGRRGRPRFIIPEDTLRHLIEHGFSVPSVSRMLGVSISTIRRRMSDLDVYVSDAYTTMSDSELDEKVREIKQLFPYCGCKMLQGHLRSAGVVVQQKRVRESLRRTDPCGTMLRWFSAIHRRHYSVPHSQYLWHIDGNHKLIRWRFIIHGGVDGFSRFVVYLHCSTNNRASTVLSLFTKAASEYGLPSRCRSDKGAENRLVALYMLSQQGTDRGSMLVGRSVHNQRIERLWRDVWQGVVSLFYHLFHFMEDEGILDVSDELHLFCLHLIYSPRINQHLALWRESWNSHPLSSCSNKSPIQVWIEGQARPQQTSDREEVDSDYGISWDDPVPVDRSVEVEVPEVTLCLSEDRLEELYQRLPFDPLDDDGNYGIEHYLFLLDFVATDSSFLQN